MAGRRDGARGPAWLSSSVRAAVSVRERGAGGGRTAGASWADPASPRGTRRHAATGRRASRIRPTSGRDQDVGSHRGRGRGNVDVAVRGTQVVGAGASGRGRLIKRSTIRATRDGGATRSSSTRRTSRP